MAARIRPGICLIVPQYPRSGANPTTSSRSRFGVQESFYDHTLRKMSRSRVEGSFFTGYGHAIQHRQPLCFLPSVSPGLVHQGSVQGSQRSGAPACARHLPSSVPRERSRHLARRVVERPRPHLRVSATEAGHLRSGAQDEGSFTPQGATGIPGVAQAQLGPQVLGPRVFINDQRRHHRRHRTSVL